MTMDHQMQRRMVIMLVAVGLLFGSIFLYKMVMGLFFKVMMASSGIPPVTVSATPINYSLWQSQLKATGSLRAIQGVNVTTEAAGIVQTIYLKPGATVNKGDVLLQENADPDVALLNSMKANVALAQANYTRDKAQYAIQAVSKATLDLDEANLKSQQALVVQQEAIVVRKTIHAPFTGRLGISAVNLGQYLNPGDKIVTLQQLDPIYADFYIPQQDIPQLNEQLPVTLVTDTLPGKVFAGKITTIEPIIDINTRNVQVEATIPNKKLALLPGMFVTVTVNTGTPKPFLTLPMSAVSFNPYGEVVYVVHSTDKNKKSKKHLIATQKLVTTGETRGDQVTILSGLKAGDLVVTSGQLKLKSGSSVIINNSVVPENNPNPKPVDQ